MKGQKERMKEKIMSTLSKLVSPNKTLGELELIEASIAKYIHEYKSQIQKTNF